MAESRREKKIPATFHFLYWQRCQCCDHRLLGFGAMPAPWIGAGLWFGTMPAPWLGSMPALGFGRCRPLDRGDAGPWFQGIHPNCFEIQD